MEDFYGIKQGPLKVPPIPSFRLLPRHVVLLPHLQHDLAAGVARLDEFMGTACFR